MPPATMVSPPDPGVTMASSLNYSVSANGARRKTPSELRQEQLKRNVRLRTGVDGESGVLPSQGLASNLKKVSPRLVDTRVAEIYPATKPHERPECPFLKLKDDLVRDPATWSVDLSDAVRRPIEKVISLPSRGEVRGNDLPNSSTEGGATNHKVHAAHILNKFRDVTEMSTMVPPQASVSGVNMAAALKLMATVTGQGFRELTSGPSEVARASLSVLPNFDANIKKSKSLPVDLSLKISARFLSSDSLHWCHRTNPVNEVQGLSDFVKKSRELKKGKLDIQSDGCMEKKTLNTFGAQFCQALFSWVHPSPQYSRLYDMVLAAARGDTRKDPHLTSLYHMWEDSFTSLYHMFQHRRCNQFYFCTQQFVVMFVGGTLAGRDKNASNAYWTRSTRGLRRLLKEEGVEFLMPYSNREADATTMEELQELTEFERTNPGQTRLIDSSTIMDNSMQSLLAFEEKNVHRLFDFLLNYRFLVGSANSKDFPILYSPVEFKMATLHAPEVNCKHMEYATESAAKKQLSRNLSVRTKGGSVTEMMYSLELRDSSEAYIPPWVIQAVCKVLQESQETGFEGSFVTGPLTEALNVAQESTPPEIVGEYDAESKPKRGDTTEAKDIAAEIEECKMKVVKHLRYANGVYETSAKALQ